MNPAGAGLLWQMTDAPLCRVESGFTVNLLQRRQNNLLTREISLLRSSVKRVKIRYPFRIDSWVVLPEYAFRLDITTWGC